MSSSNSYSSLLRHFVLLFACFLVLPASADDVANAKQRIAARQGQVDNLKSSGLIGEANTGYLSERASLNGAQKSVLTAENADRKVLYAAVAAKSGLPTSEVGKRRADQIRAGSASGIWVQLPDGSWKKK